MSVAASRVIFNQWNQIAVTMQGTLVTHFLNGVPNGVGYIATTIADSGSALMVGSRADRFTNMLGSIANVGLYNRALSASEITQNFNTLRHRYNI